MEKVDGQDQRLRERHRQRARSVRLLSLLQIAFGVIGSVHRQLKVHDAHHRQLVQERADAMSRSGDYVQQHQSLLKQFNHEGGAELCRESRCKVPLLVPLLRILYRALEDTGRVPQRAID